MNRIRELFQVGLRDRWFLANLVLRIVALIWVFTRGSASLGDSDYYLTSMRSVCAGEWGGATFRAPLYVWLLAILGGPVVSSTLLTIVFWLIGVDLSRRVNRSVALLWLFDPVLFLYGIAIMSDGLFAVFIYASVVAFQIHRRDRSDRLAAWLGVWLAGAMLARPVGIPFAAVVVLLSLVPFTKKGVRQAAVTSVIISLLVAPRLYWNSTHAAGWTIAAQGATFQMAVAAAVEYSGTGLSFYETEEKWVKEHPGASSRDASSIREALIRKFPVWFRLSAKGALRTLFGHVNVEAGTFALGRTIVGPGWFSENTSGNSWSASEKTLWIFGLLFAALYALVEYAVLGRYLLTSFPRLFVGQIAVLVACAIFVMAPQLFGDCRFRLPVLGALFAARAWKIVEKT